MNLLPKIKKVLTSPDDFFSSVKAEKYYRKQTVFLVSVVFFVFLFLTYNYIQQVNSMLKITAEYFGITAIDKIPLTIKTYFIFYLALVVLYLILAILRYWVTHLFVILFKGKGGYQQTYKAMVYTRAPEFFSAPILLIMAILLPLAIATSKPVFWILWILFLLVFLSLSIYQIILRTKGLAKLQNITYMQSFLAIYILGQITQLAIIFAVELLLVGMFALIVILI